MSLFDGTQDSKNNTEEKKTEIKGSPLHLLPFPIQLSSVFPIEIVAKRFPVPIPQDGTLTAQSDMALEEIQVNQENSQAHVILRVQVGFANEPRPFEISFKLLGGFTYPSHEYEPAAVQQFLSQGSLSVMLPFARELLVSLCSRIQVPLLILQLVQITPSSPLTENGE